MSTLKRSAAYVAALGLAFGLSACAPEEKPSSEVSASSTASLNVIMYTNGYGIYGRATPDMNADPVTDLIAEGASVVIVCETTGTNESNGDYWSNTWEKLEDGSYIPNVFVVTGKEGRNEALFPECE